MRSRGGDMDKEVDNDYMTLVSRINTDAIDCDATDVFKVKNHLMNKQYNTPQALYSEVIFKSFDKKK